MRDCPILKYLFENQNKYYTARELREATGLSSGSSFRKLNYYYNYGYVDVKLKIDNNRIAKNQICRSFKLSEEILKLW